MIDQFYFTRDGGIVTGKVPVQVNVYGRGNYDAVRAAAESAFQAFMQNVRLSLAEQFQSRVELPFGAAMFMSHVFGVASVRIFLTEDESKQALFYGGILLQPTYLDDESVHFGPQSSDTPNDTEYVGRAIYREVGESGKTFSLPGRPAVPGPLGRGVTDWLVLQIRGDRPLTDTPIANGNVKIYRIKDPQFGDIVEVDREPGKYLMSTTSETALTPSSLSTRKPPLSEFYLCGQKVASIPSLNAAWGESPMMLATALIKFPSFELAREAEGLVIMALGRALWAVYTPNKDGAGVAAWELLATAPVATLVQNRFGEITRTREDNKLIVRCSGTNERGAASGFEVTLTFPAEGRPTLTGVMSPMYLPASVPLGTATFTKTVSYSPSAVTSTSNIQTGVSVTPPFDPIYNDVEFLANVPTVTMSQESTVNFPESPPAYDAFTGELLTPYPAVTETASWEMEDVSTYGGWTDVGTGAFPYTPPFDYPFNWQVDLTSLRTVTGSSSVIGRPSGPVTQTYSQTTPPGTVTATATGYSGALQNDPATAHQYSTYDWHTFSMTWRRTNDRPASIDNTAGPTSGGSLGVLTWGASDPPLHLINRDQTILRAVEPIWSMFPTRPTWADPYSQAWPVIPFMGVPSFVGPQWANFVEPAPGEPRVQAYGEYFPAMEYNFGAAAMRVSSTWDADYFQWYGGDPYPRPPWDVMDPFTTVAFSHTITGTAPTGTPHTSMTLAEFTALYTRSVYALHTQGTEIEPVSNPGHSTFNFPDTITLPNYHAQQVTAYPNRIDLIPPDGEVGPIRDLIYRDLRTGGFIAQLHWRCYYSRALHVPGSVYYAQETYIGNDFGTMLLNTVLDEWKALGTLTGPTISLGPRHTFLDQLDTNRVMLL